MGEAVLTTHAGGYRLPESPRWHDGALWFVDMLGGTVNRLADKTAVVVGRYERPTSVGFRPNGDMLVMEADRSTLHVLRDGQTVEQRDFTGIAAFNDMIVDREGRAYIGGNPPRSGKFEGLDGRWETTGRIYLVPPQGAPHIVAEGILSPNGIALSPAGKTLILGESMGRDGTPKDPQLMAFDVAADGSLSNERTFAVLQWGSGDGLGFDSEGGLWVGTSLGHTAERFLLDGTQTDRITVPDKKWVLAVALGGPEMRTLYMTNAAKPPKGNVTKFPNGWIESVEVDVPGVPS
jgi:sugar lactone lactonase YvrE